MKRNWNKLIIIIFLAFALILSSIIVLAEENSGLKASDLAYTKQDGNTINLATALNELHDGGAGSAISAGQVRAEDIGATVKGYKTYSKIEIIDGSLQTVPSDEWQIMYADENNIYLITKYRTMSPSASMGFEVVRTGDLKDRYSGGANLLQYIHDGVRPWLKLNLWNQITATNVNVKVSLYMLDTSVWNLPYVNGDLGEWAIGGPSLEMFCKALDKYNYDNYSSHYQNLRADSCGFFCEGADTVGFVPANEGWFNNGEEYWLASPGNYSPNFQWFNRFNAQLYSGSSTYQVGFRPVVCLKHSVKLIPNINRTAFTIKR